MDDDFGGGGSRKEVSLPKATVNKFANEVAASLDVRLTADTRDLIAKCCSEFVECLSLEANEICEKDSKKTITPEHVLRALKNLGLERYLDEVSAEYEKVRAEDKSRRKAAAKRDRKKKPDSAELLRQQQELFAAARKDPMNALASAGGAAAGAGGAAGSADAPAPQPDNV